MSRSLVRIVSRVRELAIMGTVHFTLKALRELAILHLDQRDACEALAALRAADFVERFLSAVTGEWMYVFKPAVGGYVLYVKLILRSECLVVSFHEDEEDV